MPDPRQIFWLFIALSVPVWLLLIRRERWLVFWICFTVTINLFDTTIGVNLLATRLAGLLLLPITVQIVPVVSRTRSGRALLLLFFYSALLGLIFGYLIPWPAGGYDRAFNQTAAGRASIYMIRLTADFSVALFVARWVAHTRRLDLVIRYLLIGTTVAALGSVIQQITQVDMYFWLTGLSRDLSAIGRTRGLNYEPRGLGLILAHGMLLLILLYVQRRSLKTVGLFGLHAVAFIFTASTSAAVALAAGLGVFVLSNLKKRSFYSALMRFALVGSLLVVALVAAESTGVTSWSSNLRTRLSTEYRQDSLPATWIEAVAYRLDFFDGPPLIFLGSHPLYLFTGTGPGLISLPATAYLPPLSIYSWLTGTGLNNVPTMGGMLELSNTGLIGLALWLVFVYAALRAFRSLMLAHPQERHKWELGRNACMLAAVLYTLQASTASSIWAIFIGLGLGADWLATQERYIQRKQRIIEELSHDGSIATLDFRYHPDTQSGSTTRTGFGTPNSG
ncbi:MAG: hypothetical protein KF753_16080 [Caldilineaceae bacterium]|nr:hypothetical protein [Caldilineaceae bacterium]